MHNDEGDYTGSNTLTGATAYSDNSIYAEVGLEGGHEADRAVGAPDGHHDADLDQPGDDDRRPDVGVTPLDMAHAYETIAHGGGRVERHAGATPATGRDPGSERRRAHAARRPPPRRQPRRHEAGAARAVASTETSMLETVLQYGTGRAAAIGQFAAGKTGTTSNYGDAWFVGLGLEVHGRRLGRLPGQARPDDDGVQRQRRCSAAPSRR